VSNGPSFYALPVVISSLHGKTSRVVEKPVITHFTGSFSLLYNYTAHETMYFTFQWYHKVVIIIVQCIKAKPYHWPMYNIITIMAQTFWQTSEALVWAGSVPAFTCVAHAYKFFQYACALNNACP